MNSAAPVIVDGYPLRGGHAPGETAQIEVVCGNLGPAVWRGRLRASLLGLDKTVTWRDQSVEIAPESQATLCVDLILPDTDLCGYGVEIELRDDSEGVIARAATALDVCTNWTMAPRYGFLCDFAPDQADAAERLDALARYHINAIQAYDWMYRHYAFIPPEEIFTDALGRRLSLSTLRRKLSLARERGMSVLAYAAIYAAEPEYFNIHLEQGLFQRDGAPFSLGDFLYITDITNEAWRARLFAECRRAIVELGFDGIHLDQYGYPRLALTRDGARVDLEAAMPAFLNAARAAVSDAPTVFNAVNGWPLEAVALSSADPLYIEVWPPNETLRDVRDVILRARDLRRGKTPVIAAYINALNAADAGSRADAVQAFRRLTGAIYLNGGSHIALGERNAILADPYFPGYASSSAEAARAVRRDYDFIARYSEYLFDPAWRDVSATKVGGINEEVRLSVRRFGPNAMPDSIWTIAREREETLTVGLVNLVGMSDTAWNAAGPAASVQHDIVVKLQLESWVGEVFWASPDIEDGRPQRLAVQREGRVSIITIPRLYVWGLLICR